MTRLEQARDLIRNFQFPEEYRQMGYDERPRLSYYNGTHTVLSNEELTAEVIAESLTYYVIAETLRASEEEDIPLGSSKYYGLPHFPKEMTWPRGQHFVAQINCADLHHFDLGKVFPSTGMLYFFSYRMFAGTVLYYNGPADSLRVTPYPDETCNIDECFNRSSAILFSPAYSFFIDAGTDFRLPRELRAQLDSILGCSLRNIQTTDPTILGRPVFWQSEDQAWFPIDYEDEFTSSIMLFQDRNEDMNLHFWVPRESVLDRSFGNCRVTFSGS